MPRFCMIARDGTDAEAVARRQRARPAHYVNIQPYVAAGNILFAGGLKDEAGDMVGSVVFAEFPSRAALDAWIAQDPNMIEGVWQSIEIHETFVAVEGAAITPAWKAAMAAV